MPCPSLERICLEVLAWSPEPYWALQKRRMQLLPDTLANTLVQLLLKFQRLSTASQLDAFRDCVTTLRLDAGSGVHLDAEWLAHICSLRQLQALTITGVPRLRDKFLTPLAGTAGRLLHLDLSGCSGLTGKSLLVLGQLTSLHSLVLTGTSIKCPVLGHLTALQHLTRLLLGGCEVTDTDIIQHIAAFSTLEDLDLWGCEAGDASAQHITNCLPSLRRLSMAWSQVTSVLPLLPGLTWLDLSHCKLSGPYSDEVFVAATEAQQLQVLVLAEVEVDAMGCELLEVMLKASASALQVLDLTKASLDNQLPLLLALEGATKLSALSLSGTQLADDYLPTIAACTFLHTLNLSLNPDITAAGLTATLPGFAAWLERLDLHGTGVGNTLLPLLKHLPKLQQLVLADTAVSWERKAAPATAGEGDAAGGHAAAVPPRGDAPAGLPAWHGELAAGASVVQCAGPEKPPSGWAQLQVLDVAGAQLTDAGCAELAADMGGAAAAAQAHASAAAGYSSGLRVLRIGTSRHKLGRKALASIGHLTSLQQLTLQDWSLGDRDMRHLEPLQQLEQLHIKGADPWLLSDAAILQLAEELPVLSSITRDGRQLLQNAGALSAAVAAPAGSAKLSSYENSPSAVWSGAPSDGGPDASQTGVSHRAIWPAGGLPDDMQNQQQQVAVMSPWLLQYIPQPSTPGSHGKAQPAAAVARPAVASGRTSGRGPTVYQRLSAFDERFRYSSDELLHLRSLVAGTQHSATGSDKADAAPGDGNAGQGTGVDFDQVLPAEIRAGTRW